MTYTKEAITARLIAAYTGPGSTEEGSFAGDVLRACADAMAELWSMEIEGLVRRAFVSTAAGADLTAVCADRGIQRWEQEPDEELRARALAYLASTPASGNADHYRAWCGQVEDILRVKVLPLARGNGTVDILAVDREGRAAGEDLLVEAQSIVDAERPVGVDAQVCAPTEVALTTSATVTLMDGATLTGVKAAFETALTDFCRDIVLKTNTVSYAKVLRLLLDCEGVADVTGFTLCNSDESLTLEAREIPVPGEAALTEGAA